MQTMRLRRWVRRVAGWSEWIGVMAVLLILALTVVDVVGAKVFLRPLRGSLELVGFVQVIAMAAGMTMAFFARRHIQIEFVVDRLPRGVQRGIDLVVSLLGFGLFVLLAWQSILYGRSLAGAGQIASTAGLAFYPFAYAMGGFSAVSAMYYLTEIIRAVTGETADHEPY